MNDRPGEVGQDVDELDGWQPWYVVDGPMGAGVLAGHPDPQVGTFIADCSAANIWGKGIECAENIVKAHNSVPILRRKLENLEIDVFQIRSELLLASLIIENVKHSTAAALAMNYAQVRRMTKFRGELLQRWDKRHEAVSPARPSIVVLCGSTRFHAAFQRANYEETMQGKIVLSVGFYANPAVLAQVHGENVGITPEEKLQLDELHKRKIDLADEVLILNVGGYIGESTRSELEYAQLLGKPVRFLEPVEVPA